MSDHAGDTPAGQTQERQHARRFHDCTSVWRKDAARDTMQVSRNAKRTVSASWRTDYGTEDGGRHRTYPAGGDEARLLLESSQGGAG